MKRTLMMVLALVFVSSSAYAAGSATLDVQATVLGTCSFAAASTTLDFGNIDPTSGVDALGSTTIDYTCTNGTIYTLTTPVAASITDGVDIINLNLAYVDGGTGTGTGVASTLSVNGTIPAANYATVGAGVYTGSVTLDVNP